MASTPCLIVDANVMVGICAREKDKYDLALTRLESYLLAGYQCYAPGVILSEVLYVLAKKLHTEGTLSLREHEDAIDDFQEYLDSVIAPPPDGDRSLLKRAQRISQGYGASRTADAIYIALAESLGGNAVSEVLTFDAGIGGQVAMHAPSVKVNLLVATAPK